MTPVIEMIHITKEFPGIIANDDITLVINEGEIHALLGENGAGKSTLMSVLFGLYRQEKGQVKVRGQEVEIKNPNDAYELGIGMVHQHFKLIDTFSVLDNIILGYEDVDRGFLNTDMAREKVMKLSHQYRLKIDPDALVRDISVGQQQRVEILKMLYRNSDILIFDEPTAVLTPQEIDELMNIMKALVKEGKSIILITHKLNEIQYVADRVTILRKGKWIDTLDVKNASNEMLAERMVGRKVLFRVNKKVHTPGNVVFSCTNVTLRDQKTKKAVVNGMHFDLRKGEILTIAGIEGNGQTELVYGLTGMKPLESGTVTLNGEDITRASIHQRNRMGLAHIPEDRQRYGLVLDYNLAQNLILQTYFTERFQSKGFLKHEAIWAFAEDIIDKYDVRSSNGPDSLARSMSGGNQQKAILGREIERETDIIIAVQPTRGLDVGAIEFIHTELLKLRDEGKAILLISLELDEVMTLSDRIIVMFEGKHVGAFNPQETSQEELGLYMSGSKEQEALDAS